VKIEETVILVDRDDQETGTMEKMDAHLQGKLHRAFSVLYLIKKESCYYSNAPKASITQVVNGQTPAAAIPGPAKPHLQPHIAGYRRRWE
jgi:hypothetical protein